MVKKKSTFLVRGRCFSWFLSFFSYPLAYLPRLIPVVVVVVMLVIDEFKYIVIYTLTVLWPKVKLYFSK
jgi:hypothetical protein